MKGSVVLVVELYSQFIALVFGYVYEFCKQCL